MAGVEEAEVMKEVEVLALEVLALEVLTLEALALEALHGNRRDPPQLAEIVGRIREIMNEKNDIMAIAFIARYGRPLLGKKQESETAGKEEKYGNDTDRYSYSRLGRRTTHLASQ